ncbi:GDSL-type esterase/lipase family protein [Alistipes sp. OttesenSCG-928-L06]|nr:GDSL-type esterase/lipase family protein [Alistipes sp. OttesenSCG-928-L06]
MKRILLYIAILGTFAGLWAAGRGSAVPVGEEEVLPPPMPLCPLGQTVLDSCLNVIADTTYSLDAFYHRLADLKMARVNDGTNVVSVFHLGDSHIQAGFLTGTVMRNFHRDFGNAGRGLITPLKMAKTNEPTDYVIRSARTWESSRLVQANRPFPVGVGGVSISIREPNFSLTISALEKTEEEDYSFNRVHVLKYPGAPELSVDDPNLHQTASYIVDESPFQSTIVLNRNVSELTLAGHAKERRDSSIYYGFVLENTRNGVLYHSAGINGAQFLHWTRPETFSEQSSILHPDLIILSMGTNEAQSTRGFSPERFEAQIDTVVCRLREKNPQAVLLFTTPPESFLRRVVNRRAVYSPNGHIEAISEVIRAYTRKHGYACWDLYTIAGGAGSCEMWKEAGLFGRDNLHFTVEGYNTLGNYLYRAILKGYNQYVRDHYGEPAPDPEI